MKNLLLSSLLLIVFCAKAQRLELKTHLTNLLVGTYGLSAEYLIDDNISVEITPSLLSANQKTPLRIFISPLSLINGAPQTKGYTLQARAKYYFTPKTRCDNFGAGAFLRYSNSKALITERISTATPTPESISENRLIFGVVACYKKVFSNNLVLEAGIGEGFVVLQETKITTPAGLSAVVPNIFFSTSSLFGFASKLTPTFNISVGYRFGKPEKEVIPED